MRLRVWPGITFDRLLIAQAQSIPAYLLTTDAALEQYSELVKRRIAVKSG